MSGYEIIYSNNKHGYARIKEGKLIISIPKFLKYNKKFKQTLIENGEKLLKKHKKNKYIKSKDEENVLLFGEFVEKKELKWNLDKNLKNILLDYVSPIVDEYSKKLWNNFTSISIRKASSKRWSCSHDQKIMFSQNLVHLPTKYIKYVVIHEVCHLKHKNHSKEFWKEVENFLPNYREIRKEMRKMIIE
jgi:predicted metal-dependent hydrolase